MYTMFFKSKLFQLVVVLFLLASIIITGTYAWNDFWGHSTVNTPAVAPEEVTLADFSDQMGEIYVVNGDKTDMLVRVKLLQYLEVNGSSLVPGMLQDDPSTWAQGTNAEIQRYYRPVMSKSVMTMAQWKKQGAPVGDYWVADSDGWYYYAKKLPAGQSSRALLQEIVKDQFNVLIGDTYTLEPSLQAVSKKDLPDLLSLDKNSFTSDGRLLMRYLAGELVEFTTNP